MRCACWTNAPFPVVIADQRMPRVSGGKLFEIMRERLPANQTRDAHRLRRHQLPCSHRSTRDRCSTSSRSLGSKTSSIRCLVRAIEAYDLSSTNIALTERLVTADRCALLGRSAARIGTRSGQSTLRAAVDRVDRGAVQPGQRPDGVGRHCAGDARSAGADRQRGQIVRSLRARKHRGRQTLSLREVIREVQEFLRFEDQAIARFTTTSSAWRRHWVAANRVKLQQVLVNLIKNAAHAIRGREDGRVVLSLACEGHQAVIRVADNGCGMTEEVAARIWEPFFTTKGEEGTGLGLDVAKSIVESHDGSITCQTELKHGTTFTIRLPAVDPVAQMPAGHPVVAPIVAAYDAGSPNVSCP